MGQSKYSSLGIGKEITVTINGKSCKGYFGETILQIARKNGIYIPTMCYLTKVKPIASCRMCVVEVEGVEGMILSCQEKAVDGITVHTDTPALYEERQNIMKLYNVNHPLECGVCDQSGECDLQNKTLEFGLDHQEFTAREKYRPIQNWGFVSYDPNLCIMCERCVRVSNEITGDEALQLKFGGYNSEIINVKPEKNYATLGEAAAVCPVGALVDTAFKYRSNAWELTKIPSSCPHCGGGCQMEYEVKHADIEHSDTAIYRVSNNHEFASLCPAGRYGFDYANRGARKDPESFGKAIDAFRKADSVILSAYTSNEEAYLLQKLKERLGFRLVAPQVYGYQRFLRAYGSVTGRMLYGGDLNETDTHQVVMVFGTRINDDHVGARYHITKASKWERARVIYLHPMEDSEMQTVVTQFVKYEPGSEAAVAALLAATLLQDADLPEEVRRYLEDLDIGYLSAESNVGEEELEAIRQSMRYRHGYSLIVGEDLYAHPDAETIAKLLALLERYAGFNVVCLPPVANALGIALICDLDKEAEGYTVGYNARADFTLSALGDGDLDMPAINQQEGTVTTYYKTVVPMHPALPYEGYVLNDIANALGLSARYTIDYTPLLPQEKGFVSIAFDDLPDYFEIDGTPHRGYALNNVDLPVAPLSLEELEIESAFDGTVLYRCNPSALVSPFAARSPLLAQEAVLRGSEQFAKAGKLQEGDRVAFTIDGVRFERLFTIDTSLKGTIALSPSYDKGLSWALLSSYRFQAVTLEKIQEPTKAGE